MEKTFIQRVSVFLATVFLVVSVDAKEYRVGEGRDDAIPELDCVIEPSEIVDVGSAVPGVVESIHAYRSDLVKKGAIIAALESSVEQASLELAKERAVLNTAIELRQASAAFGYRTQKRNQELLLTSAISKQEMDKLKTETRIADLQVRQEKDNKRITGLEYRRAQAILQQRSIRSPVEGVVMERFKSVGEYVEDEPVLRVAQLDPLHVELIVPVDYLGRIVQGMKAEVAPGLAGSGTHLATVNRIDRVADAASGTYGVRLSLPNPDYKIPAGLRCRLGFLPLEQETVFEEMAGNAGGVPAAEPSNGAWTGEAQQSAPPPESTPRDVAFETPAKDPIEQLEDCYTIGPVADETLLRQLSERLEDRAEALVLRNESLNLDKDYLVLAAPEPDRQATRKLVARLDKAGISDRFVLLGGDNKGRVSLGAYRSPRNAAKRKTLLAAKGFETEIVPRREETKHYWLDVSLKAGADLPDQLQELAESFTPSAFFKQVVCSQQLAER